MTAVFTDFVSDMAKQIEIDTESNRVDVTFVNSGSTYRFRLEDADISDIVSIVTARSKGRTLHELLDIRDGVRIDEKRVDHQVVVAV